ncbi:5-methylthioadenosine/S-adenosylhomocysteine deaminase [Bathymodiolus platifrons methanotrophic gill symbiont]|uniref:TRZ/ATZ family hydrolase n=1 Tax=Bathymodiolus platifrons methanotrophic gill symbiont TaxID=113268 RepID=UPI000B4181A4|nr:TRZ/ATZ family hydrolase [Bathymodiolus platifrons methanotrophic gill symbiont]MCK5870180.1 TRZ/ATZ family hydrolase [Methyloprofundus sp.]TXK94315.1 N-ethylammeline chlorohydrolase [Methylococcaceae bacterium CS4]TXK95356.1 N-ethylammeline chlorohydrolase [Methylococcaceae bacterium CS5]TXL00457.1 N-ethylammeline chlorohydrolase [Methylococcaceae bacterium HT1]TXL04056.1 N-ethylammeline chlorohydrolase [Methylococcaceae bacterium CS3]TXL06263.1 N-ethylammeline chlorohydrolase [Methylococ
MQVDTVINARWIIPVEPHEVILEHHALVIHEGHILDILPQQQAQEKYQSSQQENFANHAIFPGFINAHTHVAMTLFRGIADDLPLMEWLEKHIWPLEKKWANEAFVRDGTDLAIAEMLRGGTTCFNDMYFFPEITAHQAIQHGMRANIGLIMIDFPTAWADGPEQYIEKGLALHDELRHEPLIRTPFAPHAPYTVSDEPLQQIRTLADELNLPVHMHVHETKFEVSQGERPLKRLHDLGLINPAFIAVHMTQLTSHEIKKFAQTGAHIVHCPESNLKLASGFCPVQKCLDAGINVALGTDGAASNNDLDMLGEMRSAALLAKGVAEDASAVSAATALRMATLNGAKALGIDDITGSLTIGKAADICALDLSDIETQPLYNPIHQIVYSATRHQVSDVWVAGKQCLKNKQLTTLNLQDLKSKIAQWQLKLQAPIN